MALDSIPTLILFGLLVLAGWATFRSPVPSPRRRPPVKDRPPISPQDYWLSRVRPLGIARVSLAYERALSTDEMDRLRAGVWPEDMDDKWVVYLSESSLDCWRSWSGDCFFSLPARHSAAGTTIGPLLVNTNPKVFELQDDTDVKMFEELFDRLLNGILVGISKPAQQ